MKRVVLLFVVVLAAAAAVLPATAGASVPCRDRIYNDWYPDGKIGTHYPIACYRDAIKHVRADARTYSSLVDDIRAAMLAAIARANGHTSVPAEVGKGGTPQPVSNTSTTKTSTSPSTTPHDPTAPPTTTTTPVTTVAAGATDGGSSVPLPLLVLGALALLLIATGAVGLVAKRRRESP